MITINTHSVPPFYETSFAFPVWVKWTWRVILQNIIFDMMQWPFKPPDMSWRTTAKCRPPDLCLHILGKSFGNNLLPLFSLLFILSSKLQFHWHQKSPTSWSSHLYVWHYLRCYCEVRCLSQWTEILSRVLCPDLDFLLQKQPWTMNSECEENWINCLKMMCCCWSLLLKPVQHRSSSKQNIRIWLTQHAQPLHRHVELYLHVSQ